VDAPADAAGDDLQSPGVSNAVVTDPRARLRELEKRLKDEPDNLGLRVMVAGVLRDAGRGAEAVELYSSAANASRDQGRSQQAITVCRASSRSPRRRAVPRALEAERERRSRWSGRRRLLPPGEAPPAARQPGRTRSPAAALPARLERRPGPWHRGRALAGATDTTPRAASPVLGRTGRLLAPRPSAPPPEAFELIAVGPRRRP
jgi:hypothetical protein